MSKLSFLLSALVVLVFGTLTLSADTTYTYTGNSFNYFIGGGFHLTTSDFVRAQITYLHPLADSLDNVDTAAQALSWSITDGYRTLSSSNGDALIPAIFTTNASGAITDWYVAGCSPGPTCESPSEIEINTVSGSGYEGFIGNYIDGFDESSTCCNIGAFAVNREGSWSIVATPEPSGRWLILLSIMAGCPALFRSAVFKSSQLK